tara:strand:- start:31 stop:300 length:270 start_codon:yes stop_codon:yes gene_type:complete
MKAITLLIPFLAVGCMSTMTTPKKVYVHPEKYSCDLIIPTTWDGNHPVAHFSQELILGKTYQDYMGMEYKLIPTKDSSLFVLQIQVNRP